MPPQPRVAAPADLPVPGQLPNGTRSCSGCGVPLESLGTRAFRIVGPGLSDAAVPLELLHCRHCGRVEFFSSR
ncbi:MAG TPA: hypothetical protein VJS68_02715 [Thermoplasmata archaeon]|nr:hypothetical protein [Thermoplasmata archaeon]